MDGDGVSAKWQSRRRLDEAKQAELVGMTAVAEVDIADLTSRVAREHSATASVIGTSFEMEE